MRPMRYSTFVKQATLIKLRLNALDSQIIAFGDNPEDASPADLAKIKIIDEAATKKNTEFENLLNKLFNSETPDEDIKDVEVSKLQDEISDLYIKIHSKCALFAPTADPRLDQTHVSTHSESSEATGVRLPTLNLGVFSGQPDKWIAFHSLFENTVHKNPKLADIEKFTYLLSCLTGEPLNLIKSLPLTPANYHIGYQQLIKRYSNSRLLITLHINNIIDLPSMNNSSVKQLRSFISTLQENMSALNAMQQDIAHESIFVTTYLLRKFDNDFRSKFEHDRADSQKMPSIKEFIDFVEKECIQLEAANLSLAPHKSAVNCSAPRGLSYNTTTKSPRGPLRQRTALLTAHSNQNCNFCSATDHNVYRCIGFSHLSPSDRLKYVQSNSLCNNCLGRHNVRQCTSSRSCNVCKRRHHTLLHLKINQQPSADNTKPYNPKIPAPSAQKQTTDVLKPCATPRSTNDVSPQNNPSHQQEASANSAALVGLSQCSDNIVLLGTALVQVCTPRGNPIVARAVLDSAAQQSFVSESCALRLGISQRKSSSHRILGISSATVSTKGLCFLNISSVRGHVVAANHPVVVLENITANLPACHVSGEVKKRTQNLVLADPTFDTPAPIDLLIGADLFAATLNGDPISLGENMPTALSTVFGYVLIGNTPVYSGHNPLSVNLLSVTSADLHQSIQRFWQLENLPDAPTLSPDEMQCESHFTQTHTRCQDGKYQVRLPLKQSPTVLGDSAKSALCIFKSLENRLKRNPELKKKYVEFMKDYEDAGHMVVSSSQPSHEEPNFFLPHHEVLRDNKIRVVFNASAISSSGLSLNSILHSGPKLHNDIPSIIMGFRRHRIVFTCDIRQMFRNIWVHPEDLNLQLIFWRSDDSQPLQTYRLTTVTYGMASSPYLANRVVQQLIEDESRSHPLAANALRGQIYVDDALLGANAEEEALLLQKDVIDLMTKGGFSLRKWVSNNKRLLEAVPSDHHGTPLQFCSKDEPSCNVLGIKWRPEMDVFSYTVTMPSLPHTKRSVLAAIARLYDPMGWITPVLFWAKSFMQVLWTKGLQWDDPLPEDLSSQWTSYLRELPCISDIQIPRHIDSHQAHNVQIHGFCDASEAGYCALVILRVQNNENCITSHLLIAKSRVAPLKRVSLPRLELCGAHMLSKLIQYCASQLNTYLTIHEVFAWSDSTIALSWIKTPAYRLKTFVANRVAEIQDISIPIIWSHIPSEHNPADCGSRGLLPSHLINHPLWWTGPGWLQLSPSHWPKSSFSTVPSEKLPELKPLLTTALQTTKLPSSDILVRYSSWTKLQRVTAYILRFIHHCRSKIQLRCSSTTPSNQEILPSSFSRISLQEINHATTCLLRLVQHESFSADIAVIRKGQIPSLQLQRLSPFLDENDLLRVGGRLSNSSLNFSSKHPILLPKKHFITDIIVDYYHIHYLHCGPQLLQSLISQKYWILSARSKIRNRIFRCLRCYRFKPKANTPLMADLPTSRVSPTRAFESSAVDFAGPFHVKLYPLRRLQHIKVYLCLFICMATKAVHLEVVTDLTTNAFIASLTRFISRRGLVNHIYCDNATNFIGAARQLHESVEAVLQDETSQKYFTDNEISFHFIPPRAPHFGGLWERAVQSAKHHMRRVIGEQVLTLEEFSTLCCRVEAMLNSRPITPLSSDPSELEVLTPGHFLTGGPPVILPETDLTGTNVNRLKRWQLVQSFAQNIWKRWQRDYLHTLQNRPKWSKPQKNIELGDLVLLHEDNVPTLQWKMGRVTNLFPGKDGIPRVAEVKTATGCFKRPVVKLSILPLE